MASLNLAEMPNNCSIVQQIGQSNHFPDTIHQSIHPENASYAQIISSSVKEKHERRLSATHVSFT
ncbi:hypothetical protein APA_3156 [Pseudanabaena sp. lw0831]|nr:hypothetical protein APA_3156 [Pseudanabaena sp. lw0831]